MSMTPTWLPQAALLSALVGPISHYLVWVRYEFDEFFYRIVGVWCLLQPLALLALWQSGLKLLQSLLVVFILQISYVIPLFISIAVYRLFFHPLRKFPGPFWARLWMWWKISKFAEEEKAYLVVHELHEKYGNVVRMGPRQLSINSVEAVAPIYGAKSVCFKSAQYEMGDVKGLQAIRDFNKHHARRTIWDKGLNAKATIDFVPRISRLSDLFIEKLKAYNGQPVVINEWCHYITFDVMGDIAFGRTYGQLESGKVHPAIALINTYLGYAVMTLQVPWLLVLLQKIPGQSPMYPVQSFAKASLREREKNEPESPDVMSHIINGKESKNRWPMSELELVSDTMTLQIAGSDTTYSLFVHTLYYMAKNPSIQSALRTEVLPTVSTVPGTHPNWSALQALPLLDAIITETLRVHPPVPSGMTRNTPLHPSTPTTIANITIPPDTIISVPTYTLHHDPRYFSQPDTWLPERWTTSPELVLDKRAYIPFSIGPFNCAGKAFALAETKVWLAKVLGAFEIQFAPGEDGTALMSKERDYLTWYCPDLRLCLVPREKS